MTKPITTAWTTATLGDIAEIERSAVSPESITSGTTYVGLENITSDGGFVNIGTVVNGELASTKFKFTDAHILYGKLRPYLAKIARPNFDGVCSTDILPILPGSRIDRGFLLHFLRQPQMVDYASSRTSGANLPRLSPRELAEFKVPLPPLLEQKRIADILDKADAIRRKRQEAVLIHGTMGAAAFLEFFGDPLTNPLGWKLETLETVVIQDGRGLKRGPFGGSLKKEFFVDKGFKVYEQKHAIADDFAIGSYYIDEDKFEEMKAFAVRRGDLIMSCSGTMGRVAIVPESAEPGIINQALLRISPDTSKVSSLYLKMLLETNSVQRYLYGFSRGSGLKNFPPMSEIRSLPIPIPSLERLSNFHQYMTGVAIAGNKVRDAEQAANNLFNSLVQCAFDGGL